MSQDIFRDLEEHSEYEDEPGTPNIVEFSGVSGSWGSSNPSPSSQPIARLAREVVETIAPERSDTCSFDASSKVENWTCHICPRKYPYKTLRGYQRHMADKHNIEGISIPPLARYIDPAVPSTSTQVSEGIVEGPDQNRHVGPGFQCKTCKKILKTRAGYIKHEAKHRLQDINIRRPQKEDFEKIQSEMIKKIIEDLIKEPNFGAQSASKINFLKEVLNNFETVIWFEFVSEFSSPICSLVFGKQRHILPLNQYEEAQTKLNVLLNNDDIVCNLKAKLVSVCQQNIDAVLVGRLVSRISFKWMDAIQRWVAVEMTAKQPERSVEHQPRKMRELEEAGFSKTLGNIFRAFFKKGLQSASRQWQTQSACLKETFVVGPMPIRTAQFLNKKCWFTGNEKSIVPSGQALGFFMCVEKIISVMSSATKLPTAQEVIQEILVNTDALNFFFFLTNAYFSEEDSLLFMRELLYSYVSVSVRLEEKRRNMQQDKSVRESTAALRTHLQKNYSEKVDLSDNLE